MLVWERVGVWVWAFGYAAKLESSCRDSLSSGFRASIEYIGQLHKILQRAVQAETFPSMQQLELEAGFPTLEHGQLSTKVGMFQPKAIFLVYINPKP